MISVYEEISAVHDYSRGATIFQMAAEGFDVQLEPGQVEEWRLLIKAAFILDNVLDSDESDMHREVDFKTNLDDMIVALGQGWSGQKTERIYDAAMNVKDISFEKRATDSPKKLGQLAVHEGLETARFLQLDGVDKNAAHFDAWLKQLLPFGVLVDTIIDLPQDYRSRLTQVTPNKINNLIIASRGLSLASRLVHATPRNLFKPLTSAAIAIAHDSHKDTISVNNQ